MAAKALPPVEYLRKRLSYDPETGHLYWKPKDVSSPYDERWNRRLAGKRALASIDSKGYLYGSLDGGLFRAHRVIWKLCTGENPDVIDHINHIKNDNRLSNLRSVSKRENHCNIALPANNTSGVVGVCWDAARGKWKAAIKVQQSNINLGRFSEMADAIAARKAAERQYGFHKNHGR